MRNPLIIGIAGLVILAGAYWYYTSLNIDVARNEPLPAAGKHVPMGGHEESSPDPSVAQSAHGGEENLAEFSCADGKRMTAVFFRDILALTLSDGRQLELHQAISGSGIRYTDAGEVIEFRGKGQDAYLQEGAVQTYRDCKAAE